jgi:hypothetical protein
VAGFFIGRNLFRSAYPRIHTRTSNILVPLYFPAAREERDSRPTPYTPLPFAQSPV